MGYNEIKYSTASCGVFCRIRYCALTFPKQSFGVFTRCNKDKGNKMKRPWGFLLLIILLLLWSCKSSDTMSDTDDDQIPEHEKKYEKIDTLLSSKTDIYLQFKSIKSFYNNFLFNDYSIFGIELSNEQLENMKKSTGFNMLSIRELEAHGFSTTMPVGIGFIDFSFGLGIFPQDDETAYDNMIAILIPAHDTQKVAHWFFTLQEADEREVEKITDKNIYFVHGKNDTYFIVKTTDDYVIIAQKIGAPPMNDENEEELAQLKQYYVNAVSPNLTLSEYRHYAEVSTNLQQDRDAFLYINMKTLFNKMARSESAEGAGELFFNMFSGMLGLGYTADYSGKDLVIDSAMGVEPDSLYPLMYSDIIRDRDTIFCLKEKPVLLVTSSFNAYALYNYLLKSLEDTLIMNVDDLKEKIQQLNQMLDIDIENDFIANLGGSINFAIAPLHEEAKYPQMILTFNLREQEKMKPLVTKLEPLILTALAPQGGEIQKLTIAGVPVTMISAKDFDLYIGVARNNLIVSIGKEVFEQAAGGSPADGFLKLVPEKEIASHLKNDLGCMYLDFASGLELMHNIPSLGRIFDKKNEFGRKIKDFLSQFRYLFSYSNFDGRSLTSSFIIKTDFGTSFMQGIIEFIHSLFRLDKYLVPPDVT
jgi:hypothetical protein